MTRDIPGRGPGRWMAWSYIKDQATLLSARTSAMWDSRMEHKGRGGQKLEPWWDSYNNIRITIDRQHHLQRLDIPRFVVMVFDRQYRVLDRNNFLAPSEPLHRDDAILLAASLNEEIS